LTLAADGTPANYSKVIHGIATGYSPSDGSTAATGKSMRVGYAAVNPKVIPYGTKLYVMSPDGSFVYGYCEAVDTGGFATNGSGVDIDLYFNTAYETGLLGRKSVNIYILS
jgi:3D (Asp-Asp-Asp) domain-containing protein